MRNKVKNFYNDGEVNISLKIDPTNNTRKATSSLYNDINISYNSNLDISIQDFMKDILIDVDRSFKYYNLFMQTSLDDILSNKYSDNHNTCNDILYEMENNYMEY